MKKNSKYLFFGIIFGFALSRVGASDYNLIFLMFAGEDFKLAYVILSAIVVAAIGMRVLAKKGYKGYKGLEIKVKKKPFNRNTVLGGIIFGIGWGISGACPGTVLAQVGEGKLLGIVSMLGMILGTYAYALLAEGKGKKDA
ncbi:MAG: hypothetical protein EOM59_04460 [Clostridia bacterium]|nr:hypothetical protein [Clostridia bacterium]